MPYYNLVWKVCYFAGFPLALLGVAMIYFWFKEFEKAYPQVFNLPSGGTQELKRDVRYWGYILRGRYKDLDRSDIRTKCAILRWYFVFFSVNFAFVFAGIALFGQDLK